MPIKFSFKKLPVDENGIAYDSLESFQEAQIRQLFVNNKVASDETVELNTAYAQAVMQFRSEILEILELTMDARPAARGVKKPRKVKTYTALEPAPAPAATPELPAQ